MIDESTIKPAAIAALISKLGTIGYNHLPAMASDDVLYFSDTESRYYTIVIRVLNLERSRSVSINKHAFNYVSHPDLWIMLTLYMWDAGPIFYLIPSRVFDTPGNIFHDNEQPAALRYYSTWEIKIFARAIAELSCYLLDAVQNLK